MSSVQRTDPHFKLRHLSPGETTIAFIGMAHMLKQAMVRIQPNEDLLAFKLDLIHDAKSALMSGKDVSNEIAVMDTLIDLIEMAYEAAEKAKKSGLNKIGRRER